MKAIEEYELHLLLEQREKTHFVFISTPLCGTCKLAAKMLTVMEASIPNLSIFELNVNQAKSFAQTWRIHSVPALLVFRKGLGVERIYAFHSVSYLYDILTPYVSLGGLHKSNE
ncbi:thioredoxin family protein [Bacillus sp. FJAT-45037]|uniref:thioredoxin family protein n=1 Tax=Bacillus sp. FJAT-45037 TaxID=2011007 RepID=UPI000C24D86F|nr:thioredoxin family protein [Bacillus sp. FJAT-45037]